MASARENTHKFLPRRIMDYLNKRKKTQNITVVKMIRKAAKIYDEKFKTYRSKAKQNKNTQALCKCNG